jgi:2-polyprenyl-3-methyl-5-hydroxy-6-metoxy-1,4-benzoquinol methylase
MVKDETKRIASLSDWYIKSQLNFDKLLIKFRYETIKEKLHGKKGLEMGPADGVMTQFLLNHFESLMIVEGSEKLLNTIPNAKNLIKVHSLFENFYPDTLFDSIILEHVLEHVENPVVLLQRTKTWLAPGGKIYLGVPNANSIHRLVGVKMKLLESQFQLNARDVSLGHRRVYSWDTLKKIIEESGLSLIEMGGVYLKPLSNNQIENHWTMEMIEGFYKMGADLPQFAAEIYAICE